MNFRFILYTYLLLSTISCGVDKGPKINELQLIGTHNSYKKAIDSTLLAMLIQHDLKLAHSLDYEHLPLSKQLNKGVRLLEIDVYYDCEGGRYANPVGISLLEADGWNVSRLDSGLMYEPGFKVMHIQDIDFRSHNLTFKSVLQEILSWSNSHKDHIPVFITINTKDEAVSFLNNFTTPLEFNKEAFYKLNEKILTNVPRIKIISPKDVQKRYGSLKEAVRSGNWPTIAHSRGKICFVLDASEKHQLAYLNNELIKDKHLMFVACDPDKPDAAFVILNDPNETPKIKSLVEKGYMVRTRADANTKEARKGDFSRFEKAKSSGAQLISTDYIMPDSRFTTDYKCQFDNGQYVRIKSRNK